MHLLWWPYSLIECNLWIKALNKNQAIISSLKNLLLTSRSSVRREFDECVNSICKDSKKITNFKLVEVKMHHAGDVQLNSMDFCCPRKKNCKEKLKDYRVCHGCWQNHDYCHSNNFRRKEILIKIYSIDGNWFDFSNKNNFSIWEYIDYEIVQKSISWMRKVKLWRLHKMSDLCCEGDFKVGGYLFAMCVKLLKIIFIILYFFPSVLQLSDR